MNEIVKIKNGEITIALHGDPDALRGPRDCDWTYIHTVSVTALETIVREGQRILQDIDYKNDPSLLERFLQKLVKEPA